MSNGNIFLVSGSDFSDSPTNPLNLWMKNGYGSIPINTIFSGMNIHKSQLFWCSPGVQGFDPLPNGNPPMNFWKPPHPLSTIGGLCAVAPYPLGRSWPVGPRKGRGTRLWGAQSGIFIGFIMVFIAFYWVFIPFYWRYNGLLGSIEFDWVFFVYHFTVDHMSSGC